VRAIGRRYWSVNPLWLVAIALMAAIIGGIVGGLLAARITSTTANGVVATRSATAGAEERAAVLAQAREWERQYRQIHPLMADEAFTTYGLEWQREYEQMHPQLDSSLVVYGREWQRQYEQQHPLH
jgi:hypothetical protein